MYTWAAFRVAFQSLVEPGLPHPAFLSLDSEDLSSFHAGCFAGFPGLVTINHPNGIGKQKVWVTKPFLPFCATEAGTNKSSQKYLSRAFVQLLREKFEDLHAGFIAASLEQDARRRPRLC